MDTSVQFLCFFAAYKCFNQHDEYKNFHIWIEITMFCDIWNTILLLSSVAELVLFDRIRLRFFPQRR